MDSIEESTSERGLVGGFTFTHEDGWFFSAGNGNAAWILKTTDGGRSIKQVYGSPNAPAADYRGVTALEGGRVWVFGTNNILASADNGRTWEQQFTHLRQYAKVGDVVLSSGWITKDGKGWLVGQTADIGLIVATHDFGRTWREVFRSSRPLYLDSVYFGSATHGCAVGLSRSLFCTADAGATWDEREVLPAPQNNQAKYFTKVVMLEDGRGWVLRAGGYLYQTDDNGRSWHALDLLTVPSP